jgi:hypothetical protein
MKILLFLLLFVPILGLFLGTAFLLWAAYLAGCPPEEMFS